VCVDLFHSALMSLLTYRSVPGQQNRIRYAAYLESPVDTAMSGAVVPGSAIRRLTDDWLSSVDAER
jgi:hypothetical protein